MIVHSDHTKKLLRHAKRVIIKIGSALLVDKNTGEVNRDWLCSLAEDIAEHACAGPARCHRLVWSDRAGAARP